MMTYFTGEEGAALEETIRGILHAFLTEKLQAGYPAYAGKVRFIKSETEANKRLQEESLVAVVYITFADGSHETAEWPTTIRGFFEKGQRHEIDCRLHIVTDAKCASLEGPLRDTLRDIVNKNRSRKALRELGLIGARATVDRSQDSESRGITPYSFTARAYTLE